MRSRDAAAAAVAAAALAFALLAGWATFARSGIPRTWHGTVTLVEARHEKHPGVDDAWFVAVDGHEAHVDLLTASYLRRGDRVDHDAWSRDLVVNGAHHRLVVSRDARRMMVLAPAIACVAGFLAGWRRYPGAS
ncbi:MAG TPA: hypothetical protein VFQ85_14400 [Mycobacteriales bacterium]|nr:hypothetical protein [Mycobacteriales bacterium]